MVELNRRYMVFDYETFSECDIKKCGAYEYARHPTTEILCVAFRIGTRAELPKAPARLLKANASGEFFPEFFAALMDPSVKLVAHNVFFERMITAFVFGARLMYSKPYLQAIPIERWICTAALSRSIGFPGKLADVAFAMGLTNQKDDEGHRVMLKVSKPRKPTKKNSATRHMDEEDLQTVYDYCVKDLDVETELFLSLPPMHKRERKFWILDQRINERGFAVDRPFVKGALKLIARETIAMDRTIAKVTGGALKSARQRDATLAFLKAHGAALPNLQAQTVEAVLARGGLPPICERILKIRDAISRSSTSKYKAFEARTRTDGRARDTFVFYGAHTGRDTASGPQPQNLFKRVIPQADVDVGVDLIRRRDFHTVQALYPEPMELYASAIRSSIVAPEGSVLDVGDFKTIEVRVLFWLAGHTRGLEAIKSGRDLYLEMASDIYDLKLEELVEAYFAKDPQAAQNRQLGKQTVLGAGFGIGIGGEKFQATCKQYGIHISRDLAQRAIRAYRERHAPIPRFWEVIERAAKAAMQNPGKAYRHGFLVWRLEGRRLTVELPIGRRLSYPFPALERERTMYGDRTVLTYKAVESQSKKFLRQKTWGGKLTENVVQAVARDLLMEGVLRLEEAGHSLPVLKVHDEIAAERRIDSRPGPEAHRAFLETMAQVPSWAPGLPVEVEGWTADRYRK